MRSATCVTEADPRCGLWAGARKWAALVVSMMGAVEIRLLANTIVGVGILSNYRALFWKTARPLLRRGDLESLLHVAFVSHHLIGSLEGRGGATPMRCSTPRSCAKPPPSRASTGSRLRDDAGALPKPLLELRQLTRGTQCNPDGTGQSCARTRPGPSPEEQVIIETSPCATKTSRHH
jgi:hypothetical protein